MCLRTLTGTTTKRKIGYKLLRKYDANLYTGYCQGDGQLVTKDRWTVDIIYQEELKTEGHEGHGRNVLYRSGFHIFATLHGLRKFQQAMGWGEAVAVKVRFSHVVAVGTQCGCQVIIARRIKLIEEL